MAMALADFSAFEGDQLRKIISKKHKEKKLADFRQMFFAGGRAKGRSRKRAAGGLAPDPLLCRLLLLQAPLGLLRPGELQKSAYLKANHPAEFMAAVICNQGGYYSPFAYLSEARRMGLKVLPPDINESVWPYSRQGAMPCGWD